MRPNSFIVNTSRGAVIDEAALIAALQSGHIAGAALDVVESEPYNARTNPLAKFPNVIITPHVAWFALQTLAEPCPSTLAAGIRTRVALR